VHEPYVADPAEPPPRPLLAALRPAVATLAVLLALIAGATWFLQGRGEEDPALQAPGAQQGDG
jgi:hypothetical protein